MVEVEFNLNGIITLIQCKKNEKMEEILKRFCIKVEKNKDELCFLYEGNIIEEKKTFNEIANIEDKQRKKISILIKENKSIIDKNINIKKFKNIICPKCYEPSIINIKDFKIKMSCKNNHIQENILFVDFNNTQLIDESKIICDICHQVNKSKTYNNSFFICNTCNKNICPLCNSSHDKKHNIIDYEQKYYKCKLHNDIYNSYCNNCNKNICIICENEHNNHNIISLG